MNKLYRIKLTNAASTYYLDGHGELTTKDGAWIFTAAEVDSMVDMIRNRGSYKGYHVSKEEC